MDAHGPYFYSLTFIKSSQIDRFDDFLNPIQTGSFLGNFFELLGSEIPYFLSQLGGVVEEEYTYKFSDISNY